MNRRLAKKLAQEVTNQELQEMLDRAKKEVLDWNKTSNVNKGLTKKQAWDLLGEKFDVNQDHHLIVKTNMLREFGIFLILNRG